MLRIKQHHPARNAVASLSSGNGPQTYYDEIIHWWDKLCVELAGYDLIVSGEPPQIYNNEGRGYIPLVDTDAQPVHNQVVFTWYRMPSFRWEIVCYLT